MMDSICKVYKQEFGVVGHESTWPPYSGPRIHPKVQLKRIEKDRPRLTRFLNEMDMIEIQRLKYCDLCRDEGHSRKQHLHRNEPTS